MFGGAEPLPEDDETAVYMNDMQVFDFGSKRWHAVQANQQNAVHSAAGMSCH